MDISEQLRLKLAARDAADAAGLRLTPNARAAFDSYLISRGDVIVEREDGSFSMLGESLQDALLRLSKSPGTSIYFDNGGDDHAAVPAVGGDAPNHNGGGEAEYIAKAKKLNGLSDDEWHRLDGWKKATLVEEVRGPQTGHESWRKAAPRSVLPNGMSAQEFERLDPMEKLRIANEVSRPEGFAL